MIGDLFTLSDSNTMLKDTVTVLFANPRNKRTKISSMVFHNTSAEDDVQVTAYFVTAEKGDIGTASPANELFKETVAPGDTFVFQIPEVGIPMLNENDSIQAVASVADVVSYFVFGKQD